MVQIRPYTLEDTPAMSTMIATALETVRAVGRGEEESHIRLYRPAPTVAFGRRDELNSRFTLAVQAAQERGFESLVRRVGGHAATYHRGCLVIDHFQYDPDTVSGNQNRYRQFGNLFAHALGGLGVHAGVGELPGEYCPGEYSVWGQLAGEGKKVKLIGTAQRVVAGAWWFSAGIVVQDSAPLRDVTYDVYQALGLPLDPATVGSVQDIEPLVTVDDIEDALLEAYEGAGF